MIEYAILASDLARNPTDGTVYVSVPSGDTRFPNQLVAFSPNAQSTSWALRVGSEPGPLAGSDDGKAIYVGLNGAGRIVKVDAVAKSVGEPFPIGLIAGETPLTLDIDVSPASSESVVAVAQPISLDYANGSTGPLLFRAGQRVFPSPLIPDEFGVWSGAARAEFTDAGTVFVHGQALHKVSIAGSTLTTVWSRSDLIPSVTRSGTMSSAGGRLFDNGSVIDPAGPTLLGQAYNSGGSQLVGGIPVMTDDGQRVISVTNDGDPAGLGFSIRCFDAQTFARIGDPYLLAPPSFSNIVTARRIVPWGDTGVVVSTGPLNTLLFLPTVLREMGCR